MTDKEFEKKDELAIVDIVLVIDESVVIKVSIGATIKVLWDKLKQRYGGKNMTNIIFLH